MTSPLSADDHDSDKDDNGKDDTLKEKLAAAEKAKNPEKPKGTETTTKAGSPQTDPEEDETHEEMSAPVAVKSILKNLKPSSNRYSFSHNRDEF